MRSWDQAWQRTGSTSRSGRHFHPRSLSVKPTQTDNQQQSSGLSSIIAGLQVSWPCLAHHTGRTVRSGFKRRQASPLLSGMVGRSSGRALRRLTSRPTQASHMQLQNSPSSARMGLLLGDLFRLRRSALTGRPRSRSRCRRRRATPARRRRCGLAGRSGSIGHRSR